ncbi:hypothetical protein MMC32_000945 [Xylographa parallela]|nr:hypothetical protein [Xylographa parallela]
MDADMMGKEDDVDYQSKRIGPTSGFAHERDDQVEHKAEPFFSHGKPAETRRRFCIYVRPLCPSCEPSADNLSGLPPSCAFRTLLLADRSLKPYTTPAVVP